MFGSIQGHIYGDYEPIELDPDVQQGIVGCLTAVVFILMAFEVGSPEVLFLAILMIVTFLQILTLPEALSGTVCSFELFHN